MPDLIGNAIEAAWALEDDRAYEQERQDRLDDFAPAKRSGARLGSESAAPDSARNGGDALGESRLPSAPSSAPSAHGREPRSTLFATTTAGPRQAPPHDAGEPLSASRTNPGRTEATSSEQAGVTDGMTLARPRASSCPSVASIAGRPAGRGPVSERPPGGTPTAA